MTYKYYAPSGSGRLYVAMAPLSTTSYTSGSVFQVGAWDGNISPSLSVTAGTIDLPEGEYLVEAYPFSTGAQVRYALYLDSGGGYQLVGEGGEVQSQSDTSDGWMVPAYTHQIVPTGNTYQLQLKVLASASATDSGGYIIIWRVDQ